MDKRIKEAIERGTRTREQNLEAEREKAARLRKEAETRDKLLRSRVSAWVTEHLPDFVEKAVTDGHVSFTPYSLVEAMRKDGINAEIELFKRAIAEAVEQMGLRIESHSRHMDEINDEGLHIPAGWVTEWTFYLS